jgi:hypothetical protein
MHGIIQRFRSKPKGLFLLDSLGALMTATLLFGILKPFHEHFGMPLTTLTYLSLVALLFFIYSLSCFLFVSKNWQWFLKAIAVGNLVYGCVTIGLVVYFYQRMTVLGVAYFLIEAMLVCGLVFVEWKTSAMPDDKDLIV